MKLENQCVSLELAKKLKELGVKQESLFFWEEDTTISPYRHTFKIKFQPTISTREAFPSDFTAAFTVAELANLVTCSFEVTRYKNCKWYVCDDGDTPIASSGDDCNTLADALAKMLIYLIEKGIVTP